MPHILYETYSFMKQVITTSATLETASVVLEAMSDEWWSWTSLNALDLWADFSPEPPFQQLSLSFVIPRAKSQVCIITDHY